MNGDWVSVGLEDAVRSGPVTVLREITVWLCFTGLLFKRQFVCMAPLPRASTFLRGGFEQNPSRGNRVVGVCLRLQLASSWALLLCKHDCVSG